AGMKRLAVIGVVLAAISAPATASAGGMAAWVLHGPGKGLRAGDTWVAQLRVVGCRGVPTGMVPTVTITNGEGQQVFFRGRKAGATGRYVANVVFPSAGKWSYSVSLMGYTQKRHGPFVVGPAAKQQTRLLAALPPAGAVLLVLATGLALRRRGR
ncbi:MAG: hypothetical protein M3321_10195, partial [Actinomycetota bacterium]|nr:hypothetical protein [Actinomycetota bacterium]